MTAAGLPPPPPPLLTRVSSLDPREEESGHAYKGRGHFYVLLALVCFCKKGRFNNCFAEPFICRL